MTDIAVDGHLVPVAGPTLPAVRASQNPNVPDAVLPSEHTTPLSEAPQAIVEQNGDVQTHDREPDTNIPVTSNTTVVVETRSHSVREYALMFRMHLYNGTKKVTGTFAFIKGRLSEKSTYVFLSAGVAGASALPAPWSYISMGFSVVAAMVPDHVIQDDGDHH